MNNTGLKIEVYVGLHEYHNHFQSSISVLSDYAESNKTIVQLVFFEAPSEIPDFNNLDSNYVLEPMWIGNVEFGLNDTKLIRNVIYNHIKNHLDQSWYSLAGFRGVN